MTRSLGQDYLETVLGWKTLPDSVQWPAPPRQAAASMETPPKKIFGVFTPPLNPQEEALLKKMMIAIEVTDFEVISEEKSLDDFVHVLSFHSKNIHESSAQVWGFRLLSEYLHGDPQQVSHLKKQAWEKLKQFHQEVLS